MAKNKNKVSLRFQVGLDSHKIIGTVIDGANTPENNILNLRVGDSILTAFKELTKWIEDFKRLVQEGKHSEAYELLTEKKGTLQFKREEILDYLLLLKPENLEKAQRKDFTIVLIAIASMEKQFGKIESIVDSFLTEYTDELDAVLRNSILLSKANAAAQNGKTNVASEYFKTVITDFDTSVVDKAYALRGLGNISSVPDELIAYHQQASDKFLEAGLKSEAIKDLVLISETYETENPEEALRFIDEAIGLYDCESNIDKEYSAGLHHRKAGFLFSIGNTKKALESIEKACVLREELIGNEYEKYSSYSGAKSFAEKLKDTKKVKFYDEKIKEISPLISSSEFEMQNKIHDYVKRAAKFEGDFLNEIEASDFPLFKFTAYIFNAELIKKPFSGKLEWLDKAKVLLNKKDFNNHHFSILYYTIAEAYRENNNFEEAIKNYQLCLEFNPFYYQAIQNCGAVMWDKNKWNQSRDFFKRQIEILGESPVLSYALGRSYYELGSYQDAFNHFIKANGKVKGADVQGYIDKCIKSGGALQLTIDPAENQVQNLPISIASFREALEQFSESISSNSRMHFWNNDSGTYKWIARPEERAKHQLITALEMRYGKRAIEIIQERPAGAGRIDLFITLRGGLKVVVELKICGGSGYSSSYALSGEDQLVHYLKNTSTNIGFLVVFDSRARDFGKGFKAVQSIGTATFYTTAIDMRPTI